MTVVTTKLFLSRPVAILGCFSVTLHNSSVQTILTVAGSFSRHERLGMALSGSSASFTTSIAPRSTVQCTSFHGKKQTPFPYTHWLENMGTTRGRASWPKHPHISIGNGFVLVYSPQEDSAFKEIKISLLSMRSMKYCSTRGTCAVLNNAHYKFNVRKGVLAEMHLLTLLCGHCQQAKSVGLGTVVEQMLCMSRA